MPNQFFKFFLQLIPILFFPIMLKGQIDTAFVQTLQDEKVLAFHTTLRNFKVAFSTPLAKEIQFQNYNFGVGFRVKYKNVGGSLSFPVVSLRPSRLGKHQAFGAGFNLYPAKYFFTGTAHYQRGFDDLYGDEPTFRGQDRMAYGQMIGHYVFNANRFSLRSAMQMVNRQKKSAGSWVISLPIELQHYETDSLNIPLDSNPDFKLNLYQSIMAGVGGGYGYSQVFNNLTFTAMATAGVEFRQIRYRNSLADYTSNRLIISPRLSLFGSVVYNTTDSFGGVVLRYMPASETAGALNIRIQNWDVRLMVGRRLKPDIRKK